MDCFSERKIQEYLEEALSPLESSLLRDHLLVCPNCRRTAEHYLQLGKHLQVPPLQAPPEKIIRHVLRQLYPELPRYSAIFALIALSAVFLVTWIYIYFDFANNSLVQALRLTSQGTAGFLASIIKLITAIFSSVYAAFKTINAVIHIFVQNPPPIGLTAAITGLLLLLIYPLLRLILHRFKGKGSHR